MHLSGHGRSSNVTPHLSAPHLLPFLYHQLTNKRHKMLKQIKQITNALKVQHKADIT